MVNQPFDSELLNPKEIHFTKSSDYPLNISKEQENWKIAKRKQSNLKIML